MCGYGDRQALPMPPRRGSVIAQTRLAYDANKTYSPYKQGFFALRTHVGRTAEKPCLCLKEVLFAAGRRQVGMVLAMTSPENAVLIIRQTPGMQVAGVKSFYRKGVSPCRIFASSGSTAVRLFRRRSRGASSRVRPTCCRRHSGIRRRCRGVRRWGCPYLRAGRRADRGQRHAH